MFDAIDPVNNYDYLKYMDAHAVSGNVDAEDEFYSMLIEQVFLNNFLSKNEFLNSEEDEEDDSYFGAGNIKLMNEILRDQIVQQVVDGDVFGIKADLKQRSNINASE